MKTKMISIIRQSRTLQATAAGFGAILLGAVGSGLWDIALSPIVDWVGDAILTAGSWTFEGFADSLYRQVSRDPLGKFARFPYFIIVPLFIVMPWVFLFLALRAISRISAALEDSPDDGKESDPKKLLEELPAERRNLLRLIIPFTALVTLLWASSFYRDHHAFKAAMFVDRSIAILAPKIDNVEVLRLRASFRSIETAEDFYDLEDQLRRRAGKLKDVNLPEFKSIRSGRQSTGSAN